MRTWVLTLLFVCGLCANAQDWRYRDRGYDREPLNRVRADLERAGHDMYYLSGGERRRLNKAREEIGEFQTKWERGRYDKGELNDVISSVQHVVDHNRLQPRDREYLMEDLARLREFRARGGYSGYGYR
jgi:hypothetical protein